MVRTGEQSFIRVARRLMVVRDEAHHTRRPALDLRLRRATACVVEIPSESGLAVRDPLSNTRRETSEEHSADAMPEPRVRWLSTIMQQTSQDQLLIRAEPA